jgi:hypothetical protein
MRPNPWQHIGTAAHATAPEHIITVGLASDKVIAATTIVEKL